MNALLSLRQSLKDAEQAYKSASTILDGNGVDIIIAKAKLKEARFNYHMALEDAHEEQIAFDKGIMQELTSQAQELKMGYCNKCSGTGIESYYNHGYSEDSVESIRCDKCDGFGR